MARNSIPPIEFMKTQKIQNHFGNIKYVSGYNTKKKQKTNYER
jgi:hypothetical protein